MTKICVRCLQGGHSSHQCKQPNPLQFSVVQPVPVSYNRNMKITLTKFADDCYNAVADDQLHAVQREYGLTPRGNPLSGDWVYRVDGKFIDFHQRRTDLAERHGLELKD